MHGMTHDQTSVMQRHKWHVPIIHAVHKIVRHMVVTIGVIAGRRETGNVTPIIRTSRPQNRH